MLQVLRSHTNLRQIGHPRHGPVHQEGVLCHAGDGSQNLPGVELNTPELRRPRQSDGLHQRHPEQLQGLPGGHGTT